jgi:hypothetical protein
VVLVRLPDGDRLAQRVIDAEVFEGIDLALLVCRNLDAEILPFTTGWAVANEREGC